MKRSEFEDLENKYKKASEIERDIKYYEEQVERIKDTESIKLYNCDGRILSDLKLFNCTHGGAVHAMKEAAEKVYKQKINQLLKELNEL